MIKKNGNRVRRFNWLNDMIEKHGFTKGAEIGCHKGHTTHRILAKNYNLKLICVDLWEFRPDVYEPRELSRRENEDQSDIYNQFVNAIFSYKKRIKVLRGISWEMAEQVEDESLDFIFIDADHGYESVKKDILAWVPKVRKGGLISGHDIVIPGVYQAVQELITNSQSVGIDTCWFAWKE